MGNAKPLRVDAADQSGEFVQRSGADHGWPVMATGVFTSSQNQPLHPGRHILGAAADVVFDQVGLDDAGL